MIDCEYRAGNEIWDYIVKQVKRMGGLEGYPNFSTEAQRELCLALCNYNNTAEITAAVDDFVKYGRECPKPADIRVKCFDQQERDSIREEPPAKHPLEYMRGRGWDTPEMKRGMEILEGRMEELRRDPSLLIPDEHGHLPVTQWTRAALVQWPPRNGAPWTEYCTCGSTKGCRASAQAHREVESA